MFLSEFYAKISNTENGWMLLYDYDELENKNDMKRWREMKITFIKLHLKRNQIWQDFSHGIIGSGSKNTGRYFLGNLMEGIDEFQFIKKEDSLNVM